MEARSCNHCCSGKAINITQPAFVPLAIDIEQTNAHAPHYHMWPAQIYNTFPHYLKNGTIIKKKITEQKFCD